MGARFTYTVETLHFDNDKGEQENVIFLINYGKYSIFMKLLMYRFIIWIRNN